MGEIRTIDSIDELAAKKVLLRVDLNVPMKNGSVTDTTRISRSCPTIREISDNGGRIILLSHFGRPKGRITPELSLEPVVESLQSLLNQPVGFVRDCIGGDVSSAIDKMKNGDVMLLENTRFHSGEETNDSEFSRLLSENGEIFVNDAFSAAHRAHASTVGIANFLPAYAGRSLELEHRTLNSVLSTPDRPVMAIVGGAKVSTKIDLLENLIAKVDMLTIGGGMANTFLAAKGVDVGKSLCEHDLKETASRIMEKAKDLGSEIILPIDAVTAENLAEGVQWKSCDIDSIDANSMILDVGEATVAAVNSKLEQTRTLLWNGPFGAFETKPFDKSTNAIARFAAGLSKSGRLKTVAGGGDTVSALNHAGATGDFTFVSTAGGAFLEWLEGRELPGIKVLEI